MGLRFLAATVGIAAVVCQPTAAKDALVLEPSTPWTLEYEADSCALRRIFGEGDRLTLLEMRRFSPGNSLQTTIASKTAMTRRNFRFRLGDGGEWEDHENPLYAYFDDGLEGVIFRHSLFELPLDENATTEQRLQFHVENDVAAMEAEVAGLLDSLTISRAFRDDLVLETGSLKKPILSLNECIDELMTHWDIDAEAHKTLTRSAAPIDLDQAARMIGYPPKMAQRSLPGLVNIRLDIDETGRVTECHIQMPLSDPVFEESSCADIQHAFEFDPALDKDGQPLKSYYVTSIRFQIASEYRYGSF